MNGPELKHIEEISWWNQTAQAEPARQLGLVLIAFAGIKTDQVPCWIESRKQLNFACVPDDELVGPCATVCREQGGVELGP